MSNRSKQKGYISPDFIGVLIIILIVALIGWRVIDSKNKDLISQLQPGDAAVEIDPNYRSYDDRYLSFKYSVDWRLYAVNGNLLGQDTSGINLQRDYNLGTPNTASEKGYKYGVQLFIIPHDRTVGPSRLSAKALFKEKVPFEGKQVNIVVYNNNSYVYPIMAQLTTDEVTVGQDFDYSKYMKLNNKYDIYIGYFKTNYGLATSQVVDNVDTFRQSKEYSQFIEFVKSIRIKHDYIPS